MYTYVSLKALLPGRRGRKSDSNNSVSSVSSMRDLPNSTNLATGVVLELHRRK